MGDEQPRPQTMAEKLKATRAGQGNAITQPAITQPFQIIGPIMGMIANDCQFHGKDHEDGNEHLRIFNDICNLFKLNQFFPASRAARLQAKISQFRQKSTSVKSIETTGAYDDYVSINAKLDKFGRHLEKMDKDIHGMKFNHNFNCPYNPQGRQGSSSNNNYQNQLSGGFQQQAPGFFRKTQDEEKKSNLESMIEKLVISQTQLVNNVKEMNDKNKQLFTNQQASIQNLEKRIGNLSDLISERKPGELPSNTKVNPRNEHLNAITTRSGKAYEAPNMPVVDDYRVPLEKFSEPVVGMKSEKVVEEVEKSQPGDAEKSVKAKPAIKEYQPPLPYPMKQRLEKLEAGRNWFMDMIKSVNINMPFIDVIAGMPRYARFLKDMLTNRKKMEQIKSVVMNATCSAVVLNELPEKLDDPGCFTIPCLLGQLVCMRALADLGASINLMPYSVYLKLDPGLLKTTRMAIQLADHNVKFPRGIVENMLVREGNLIFLADFMVLDMEEDTRVPLILGRPFLNMARCIIYVYSQCLTLRIDGEFPKLEETGECDIASGEEDMLEEIHMFQVLMANVYEPTNDEFKELEEDNEYRSKSSIEDPPELERKPLPDHLEYAYL
ncbi:uncharacterized protein [Rutidosis leptorrhynchoides]|uniref:uncharacterized protein n=1 Tax=Rutidosis leptorrhynchoides TaxID=125765 RepID=UPI003A9A6015